MTEMSPIVSEFPTAEAAAEHDAWVRAKVARALASSDAAIPHDRVMAETRAIIEARRGAPAPLAR